MASLRTRFADRVTWHYHEFNQPDSARVNADFDIKSHPVVFLLDRRGKIVRSFRGVVPMEDLVATLQPLVKQ